MLIYVLGRRGKHSATILLNSFIQGCARDAHCGLHSPSKPPQSFDVPSRSVWIARTTKPFSELIYICYSERDSLVYNIALDQWRNVVAAAPRRNKTSFTRAYVQLCYVPFNNIQRQLGIVQRFHTRVVPTKCHSPVYIHHWRCSHRTRHVLLPVMTQKGLPLITYSGYNIQIKTFNILIILKNNQLIGPTVVVSNQKILYINKYHVIIILILLIDNKEANAGLNLI